MSTRPASPGVSSAVESVPDVPGYEILEIIGQGAWARVYRARSQADGAVVACKVLGASGLQDPQARRRFLREVDVLRAFHHPSVLGVHLAGECNGSPYLVMPYCAGGDLEALRRRSGGRLSVIDAFRVLEPALAGLAAVHARGFVHRDVKPHNILMDHAGRSILADFGLAKCFEQAGLSSITSNTGSAVGTALFMAREQVMNFRFVDPATDVWAAAATFYYLVTGFSPRKFGERSTVVDAILFGELVPIRDRDPSVPGAVAKVLDRALSDDVEARHSDAGALLKVLRRSL